MPGNQDPFLTREPSEDYQAGLKVLKQLLPELSNSGAISKEPQSQSFAAYMGQLAVENAFGSLWHRPNLGLRGRSLVTLSLLVAQGRADEMRFHFRIARRIGLTQSEIEEVIYMAAAYAGFPAAAAGMAIGREVFDADDVKSAHNVPFKETGHSDAPLEPSCDPQERAQQEEILRDFLQKGEALWPNNGVFCAGLGRLAQKNLVEKIWTRDGLVPKERVLVSLGLLTGLRDDRLWKGHLALAKALGLTSDNLQEVVFQTSAYGGFVAAEYARQIIATHMGDVETI